MLAATNQVRWLANLRRKVRVAMLRSRYTQQAQLAAQISHEAEQSAVDLMALRASLRATGQELAALGEIPPHLPDHIHRGQPRCEP